MAEENEGAKRSAEDGASSPAGLPQAAMSSDPAPAYEEVASASAWRSASAAAMPTVSSPFHCPTKTPAGPPAYRDTPAVSSAESNDHDHDHDHDHDNNNNNNNNNSNNNNSSSSSSSSNSPPIVFPQARPDAGSPLLPAYAPALLRHGITNDTWRSFLDTVSAFLAADASDRAVHHAADVAQHLGQTPRSFGRNVAAHARSIGKDVADNARRGNVLGAAVGAIVGSVTFPVATALGAVGTTLSLPGSALGAAVKKPRTPRERAAAYAADSNKEWLHRRGLHAQLVDSVQLAQLVGLSVDSLLRMAWAAKESDGAGKLRALEPHIARLEVQEGCDLHLKPQTLWLVLLARGSSR